MIGLDTIGQESKGAAYQYHWIKFANKEQIALARTKLLENAAGSVLAGGKKPDDGGQKGGPGKNKKKKDPQDGGMKGGPGKNKLEAGRDDPLSNVHLGFIVTADQMNRSGMALERVVLDSGVTKDQAQAWIETPDGKNWASGAFCVLSYVCVAAD